MMKKMFQGCSNIGKTRFFNKKAFITLLLICTFAVQTVSGVTMSSLTQTTNESNQLSNIQEQILEYLQLGGNEHEITIQQESIDSDINIITKITTEPEEPSNIKRTQQPIDNPITLDSVPVLDSPSNGATITDSTPYMNWHTVEGNMDSQIQIDNNADFSSPVVDHVIGGIESHYTVPTPLSSGTYYWRVREQNYYTHNWGYYTGSWSFTLDIEVTVAPTLVLPTDMDYINDDTPYLDWSSVPNAANYQVQVDNSWTFLFLEVNSHTSNTYLYSPHLVDNNYYWRVRGYNGEGNGPWSDVWEFTVDTVPPSSVSLVSPSNGAVTSDYTPFLDWNTVTGGYRYRLEVDDSPTFSSPLITYTTFGSSYTTPNLLNDLYYWRVRATDQAGNDGSWSSTWHFTINKAVPSAPVLITPTYGDLTNDITPFMDWYSVSGGIFYQIQIDNNGDFSSPNANIITSSTYYTPSALGDGKYYWHVRARDSIGNWGPWCSSWYFTIDTVPPGTPMLIIPTQNQYITGNTPYMDWHSVSGGHYYQIQIDNNEDFSSLTRDYTSTATDYTPSTLGDGKYYWRVRSIDLADNVGEWSSVRYFTIDTVPPGTPTLVVPTNDEYINYNTPYLDWTSASGGYDYQLQVDNDADFSSTIVDQMFSGTAYTPSALGDGTYYWRVRAIDLAGNVGAWSEEWLFTIDTIGPDQVILYHPINGNVISDSTPLLEWYASTDAIEYQILVDITDAFSSPFVVAFTNDVSFNIDTVLADGVYYWKVQAKDSVENWGEWSETWSFTIDATGPDQPPLSSPANETLSNDNLPRLVAGIVSTAVTYQFQIATSDSFDTLIINIVVPANYYDVESALIDGTYYWRVRAADSLENWSEWSETWVFTVDATSPDQPSLSSPANGTISNDNEPQLVVDIVPTAVKYEFQIATSDSFDTIIANIDSDSNYCDLVSALIDGTYYWRVRAADSLENLSEWSETWVFTIDTTGPNQVSLNNPIDGDIMNDSTPLLEWYASTDAIEYQILVDITDAFSSPFVVAFTNDVSFNIDTILADGVYYWKVRAKDSVENWGEWSEIRSFTIDTTNPEITQPVDITYNFGALNNNITWTLTDLHANTYTIYLNGTELISEAWISGDNITRLIDGLAVGTYNYTIIVSDLAGNSFTDTVIVTVLTTIPEINPITGLMIIGLCGAIASLTIKQKLKKKK